MISKALIIKSERLFNILELSGIVLLLAMAFVFQFLLNELPCPLCELQRFGFLSASLGLLMNLRFGFHPSHYAMVIFSSLFTAFTSLRQVALHLLPGVAPYGNPFLGLHLYTWSFIIAVIMIIASTLMLSIDRQYESHDHTLCTRRVLNSLFVIIILLITANIIDIWVICGAYPCPDNPSHYIWQTANN